MNRSINILIIIGAIAAASCAKEESVLTDNDELHYTFAANLETDDTKAVLHNNGALIYWEPEDAIRVFSGNASGKFCSTLSTEGVTSYFSGDNIFPHDASRFFAIYPYSSEASYDTSEEVATVTIPSVQIAVKESFDKNSFIMLAQSDDKTLNFRNLCGGIRVSVTQDGVNRIVFKGNNGEPLAGTVEVHYKDGVPVVKNFIDSQSEVILQCNQGETFEKNAYYYLSCLPATLSKGYTACFDKDICRYELTDISSKSIKRAKWSRIRSADQNSKYDIPIANGHTALYKTSDNESIRFSAVSDIKDHYYDAQIGFYVIVFTESLSTWSRKISDGADRLTEFILPSEITSIDLAAFSGCSGLTSVTIPSSVTSIGNWAFRGCSGLTSITIPSSVTSIGSAAFDGCSGLNAVYIDNLYAWVQIQFGNTLANPLWYAHHLYLNGEEITNLIIPSGVTSIGNWAFNACSGLTSVTIPSSVTSIGRHAFRGCSGLTSVTIPSSVTSIGSDAFDGCSGLNAVYIDNLYAWVQIQFGNTLANPLGYAHHLYINSEEITNLIIPSGVTSIGNWAFNACSGLTSVTIPSSVTSIGNWAFNACSGLTSVTIPSSVTSIGSAAFDGCSGLNAVYIDNLYAWMQIQFGNSSANPLELAHHLYLNGEEIKNLIIPSGVTSVGNDAFNGCSGLTSVTIPSSVTSVGNGAFCMCSSLTSVTIPSSVTSVGDSAFYGCSGLTSVTMQPGVTSVGNDAFDRCSSLTSVTIPSSVTSIGGYAFSGCSRLNAVYIDNLYAWMQIHFVNSSANPLELAHHLYLNGEEIKNLIIPSGITSIGGRAFYGCSSLTSLTIPSSVTSVGNEAFRGCSGLTSVTMHPGVAAIGDYAFNGCSSLTSVTIPSSVTSIGSYAFNGCSKLSTVISLAETPPAGGTGMFKNNSSSRKIYVPFDSVTDYITAPFWSDYANDITSITNL